MEIINRSTSQAQAKRIHSMMLVSCVFFTSRIIVEGLLGIPILFHLIAHRPLGNAMYWSMYILLKHLSEVVALGCCLLVSSAIKSYDNRPSTTRYNPLTAVTSAQEQFLSQARQMSGGSRRSYGTVSPVVSSGGEEDEGSDRTYSII